MHKKKQLWKNIKQHIHLPSMNHKWNYVKYEGELEKTTFSPSWT
jgi:hypothetical protein